MATHSGYVELEKLALDLSDVRLVLETGFDCSKSKRKEGVLERCLRKKGKVLRVVVSRDHNVFLKEDVWVVVHVSLHGWIKKLVEGGKK